ncbi:MAG: glycogen/starch/alpha-glucan phosphorylase [Oscillospiraceae bacterium]
MVLADFDSYAATQRLVEQTYKDSRKWNRMSLVHIAESGVFSADRSIRDYANTIWHIRPTEG